MDPVRLIIRNVIPDHTAQMNVIETKGSTILEFLKSQRGTLHVAFEEGTQAAWLYDLIHPRVAMALT